MNFLQFLNKFKITLLAIAVFVIANNFLFMSGNILSWDVFGYYLYLPFGIIYNDIKINNINIIHEILEKYNNSSTFYQASILPDGGHVIKYTSGLAIIYFPFFILAHFISFFTDFPSDGFSAPYQYSIFIGGIIYSLIGLFFLLKLLLEFFSEKLSIVLVFLIVFSSNYLIHITMHGQNSMSHNYLFTFYVLILYNSIQWHKKQKWSNLIVLSIVSGLTILIRPSEIVCLIIPLLWGVYDIKSFKEKLKLMTGKSWQMIAFGAIVFAIGSIQLLYWKITVGEFLYYSYGNNPGEGFEFKTPFIKEVLFSFRKGWLIYTPIMIFAILGFVNLYRKNRKIFWALFVYFVCNLYIVSSWSCWWYAQSFSQRALIPSYPIMLIALGYFLMWVSSKQNLVKLPVYAIFVFFVLLNIFQTWQYNSKIIDGDRMTKDYYFASFGKLSADENAQKLLLVNRTFESTEIFENEEDYRISKTLKLSDFDEKYADSLFLSSNDEFTKAIELEFREITEKDHAWLRIRVKIKPENNDDLLPFSIVAHAVHNDFMYKYQSLDSEKIKINANEWNEIIFDYLTPEVRRKNNLIKCYFWNRGKGNYWVKDFEIEVFERK